MSSIDRLNCSTLICFGLLLGTVTGCKNAPPEPKALPPSSGIAVKLRPTQPDVKITIGSERLYSSVVLKRFYLARQHRPAWIHEGCPSDRAFELLDLLKTAHTDGLRPSDYHVGTVESLLEKLGGKKCTGQSSSADDITDLDLALTDAFLIYGSHLLGGRINPVTMDPEWHAQRRDVDLAQLLDQALSGSVRERLNSLLPTDASYRRLKQALARYRQLARTVDWIAVESTEMLEVGSEGVQVARLRHLLASLNLLADAKGNRFDVDVEKALRLFQRSVGLAPTGELDAASSHELNVPPAARVQQLEVNLERWRWLPQSLGENYIMVRVPNYDLIVVKNGHIVLRMRAIVGKLHRRTPMLSSAVSAVVLNPSWQIPRTIAVKDIAPEMRKNPNYLKNRGISVFASWDSAAPEVDPKSVDWSKARLDSFKYRLRQKPGSENALGKVKFLFPNKFSVYLHDTPIKNLFAEEERTFSSGCIRLEKAMDLAEYLLREQEGWSREKISGALGKGLEIRIALSEPIPVHLSYLTSWVDPDGLLQFRRDFYGRDRRLAAALQKPPPGGS